MPVYEYQCSCGLLFEKFVRKASANKIKECPNCHLKVDPKISAPAIGFSIEGNGPGPSNTGVSDYDLMVDRVIAADAKKGYQEVALRKRDKREFMRDSGATQGDLARNPDGSYRVMTKEEKKQSHIGRAINILAMNHLLEEDPSSE